MTNNLKDGGTTIYCGAGYKLYAYHGYAGDRRALSGLKIDILYIPFLSVGSSFFINKI